MTESSQFHSLDMASHTSESELMPLPLREELLEFDSKSGGSDDNQLEGGDKSADEPDEDANTHRAKRKRYHRHTQHQIQEMEAYFKENPHPDDKQRKELSRELGLDPLQIKFWFQNKRTQMKNQHERHENSALRADNEKLRFENVQLREALNRTSCPTCGGPTAQGDMSFEEHQLNFENVRLREEVAQISALAATVVGKPTSGFNVDSPPLTPSLDLGVQEFSAPLNENGDLEVQEFPAPQDANEDAYGNGGMIINGPTEAEKPYIMEIAVAAMEELHKMVQLAEPLWVPSADRGTCYLNQDEYVRVFPSGIGPTPEGFKAEASKESAVVIMNHINLVEILMDVNQWSSMFSNIVSRAALVDVLSTGVAGNYNGAIQVIFAEYHVPSPQVPTRDCYFLRYCKKSCDGIWAVVDVSLDHLRATPIANCRRRPSGCFIQEQPNGYSRVTWIEHVEIDDSDIHGMYKPLVNSGLAFGAKRWIATLDRQCERLASAMATNIPNNDANIVLNSQEGRKSMLKLAERMVISFCSGVSATSITAHQWTTLSGTGSEDDVRVMTRKSVDDPGRPPGTVLSAATSFWIPIPPKTVFDFLRDHNARSEWDILSNGGVVQEMAHIANGRETGNCVSLLRVNSANSGQSNMLILQESSTDPTGSYVVYAPVDVPAMNTLLGGGDPDYVALLPSGFAILPDGPPAADSGGSLLSVAFQILVDSIPTDKLSLGSVATVNNLIACTVDRIQAALFSETQSTIC